MRLPNRRVMLPFVAVSLMVVFGSLSLLRKEELSSNAVHLRSHHPEEMKALVPNGAVHAPAEGSDASLAQESWAPKGEGAHGIRYVALIAERHSGSTWMVNFLKTYFRDRNVTVTSTLCTWKHWFQDRIYEDTQAGKRQCREGQRCPACKDIKHTLVIAMWRNPYDWMSGMNKVPHHAKEHLGMTDLSQFMSKRWMLDAKHERAARKDALTKAKNQEACMDNFLPWEVVPCRDTDRSAIYELDEDGEAYSNLYELRKAKIKDFNAVANWAPHYEKILYEDMLEGDGLKNWLASLEDKYGLAGNHANVPNLALSEKMAMSRSGMYYMNSERCTPHCTMGGLEGRSAVDTLHELWDEKLESSIGYHQVLPTVE